MLHETPDHKQVQSVLDRLSHFVPENKEEDEVSSPKHSLQYLPQMKGLLLFVRS